MKARPASRGMLNRALITIALFVVVGAAVMGVGAVAVPEATALPQPITATSTCPVAGCTQPDGACHAAAAPPVPDGSFTMVCPHVQGCADTQCHAYDRMTEAGKPSDASLNLWILAPTVLAIGLVALVKKFA